MVNQEKCVLVTGGAGFIGSHVVDRLIREGYSVRVLDDLSSGKLANIQAHLDSGAAEFLEGDIRDKETVKQAVKGVCGVVHLAAQISVSRSVEEPDFTFDVNVGGTQNLLAAASEAGVGRFVFASSCAVYGEPQSLPVSGDTATMPISPYAESKLLGERLCLGFSHRKQLQTVALRFFNVFGPRQALNDYSGVITIFIENAKANQPLTVFGDGLQTRDFVYVADVAGAVCAALTGDVDGEVINIGTGYATSINQLAEAIKQLTDSTSTINVGFVTPPKISSIANAIYRILHADNLRQKLSVNGKNFVSTNLSIARIVDNLEQVYSNISQKFDQQLAAPILLRVTFSSYSYFLQIIYIFHL